MNKQPRDVTGGEAVWGAMIPGLGLINYIWGILTVPIEVLLRRNMGERYFTQANFVGGLILLLLIQFVAYLFALLSPLNIIGMMFGNGGAAAGSWMGSITKWYFVLGMLHFIVIWWRNVIGTPVHTFSAGKSWLRPIGKVIMFVLNLFLDNIVRLIFAMNRKLDKRRLEFALPVLSDVDVFTEKWVEPAFVFLVGFLAAAAGQFTVFCWLTSSAMALNMYTGLRHQQERGYWLNIQDSIREAEYFDQAQNPDKYQKQALQRQRKYERIMKKAAYEVQRNPDMAKIIERNHPTLADAMRAVHTDPISPGEVNPALAA